MLGDIKNIISERMLRIGYHMYMLIIYIFVIACIIAARNLGWIVMFMAAYWETLLGVENVYTFMFIPLTDKELKRKRIAAALVHVAWWGLIRIIALLVWHNYSLHEVMLSVVAIFVTCSLCVELALDYSIVRKKMKHRLFDSLFGFVIGGLPGAHLVCSVVSDLINLWGIKWHYFGGMSNVEKFVYELILCAFALIYTIYVIVRCKPVDEEYSVVKQ